MSNTEGDKKELRVELLKRDYVRPEGQEVQHDEGNGLELAERALAAALDKKALDPILLDVRGLCSYSNYLLLLTGRSDRQVDAISDGVREAMKGIAPLLGSEGVGQGQWALLDFGDTIVHVFQQTVRERYDLEGLWVDAPRVALDVPEEARISLEDRYSRYGT